MSEGQIIVSGGAGGIGRAMVRRLVGEGRTVCVPDLDTDGLERLVAVHGEAVRTACVDVGDCQAVAEAVSGWAAEGPLWGLVNNAGWDRSMPFTETTPEFR